MIEIKPTIAYLDEFRKEYDSPNNMVEQGAFISYLSKDLSFDVIQTDCLSDKPGDLSRILIENAHKKRLLCLFVLKEDRWDQDTHEVKQNIKKIRKRYGGDIPILVIPYVEKNDKVLPGYNSQNVYISNVYSKSLKQMLSRIRERHQENVLNETRRLSQTEVGIMSQVYDANYPDNDCLISLDNNSKSVIEFIRINLLPSVWRKSEFDDHLPMKINVFRKSRSSEEGRIFNEDFLKIQKMDEPQRQIFIDNVDLNAGWKRDKKTGGFWVVKNSRGSDISGFAINIVTKETLLCDSWGKHALAGPLLEQRKKLVEAIRKNERYCLVISFDGYVADPDIVTGLLHHSNEYLPDFKTPILQMFVGDLDSESKLELGRYLMREKNVISIDSHGNLLCDEI